MVTRFSISVCRASCLAACVGACLNLVVVGDGRAAEPEIQFLAPESQEWDSAQASPSTVVVTEQSDGVVEVSGSPEAASDQLEPVVGMGPVDLAALASYAQAAAEEIDGEPVVDESRPFRPITEITIDAALPDGVLPGQEGTADDGETPYTQPQFDDARLWGGWAQTSFQWSATRLCHRPLYFEEVNLERYGYTVSPWLQPAISGAHFFLTIPTIPYKMVVQPPRECVYTLGYYRSGSPAPRRWHHMDLVWDPTAVAVEGLLVTGLVFLIP